MPQTPSSPKYALVSQQQVNRNFSECFSFPRHYHSTNAIYSITHHRRYTFSLGNWERHQMTHLQERETRLTTKTSQHEQCTVVVLSTHDRQFSDKRHHFSHCNNKNTKHATQAKYAWYLTFCIFHVLSWFYMSSPYLGSISIPSGTIFDFHFSLYT